ncbi:MAG: DUF3822 family protein [Prolixibacteraceae bacterium]|nr:DUF3822 family protein [Prolixibacteraceae bacterium]
MYELITDPSYDLNRPDEYKLSIQVSPDGFSFSLIRINEQKLIALGNFPVTVSSETFLGRRFSDWLESHEILQQPYIERHLLYFTDKFTIVPAEYYIYEKQDEIGSLIFGKHDDYAYRDNYMPETGSNLIFRIPVSFLNVAEQKFPNIRINHPVSILNQKIESFINNFETLLVLLFGKKSFSAIVYTNGKLLLINNYLYSDTNDVVFYIASILNSPGMKQNPKILVAGEIIPDGKLYDSLKKYFPGTDLFPSEINFDKDIFRESMHRFLTLY